LFYLWRCKGGVGPKAVGTKVFLAYQSEGRHRRERRSGIKGAFSRAGFGGEEIGT